MIRGVKVGDRVVPSGNTSRVSIVRGNETLWEWDLTGPQAVGTVTGVSKQGKLTFIKVRPDHMPVEFTLFPEDLCRLDEDAVGKGVVSGTYTQ